ncbi:MAG: hypothetical protein IT307_04590 [Chloroflexi bacterium]|nr:hypothetical protein [Chloroflexota bacterium]
MKSELLRQIQPGMPVYDLEGREIGAVHAVFDEIHLPRDRAMGEPWAEEMLEVQIYGVLGLHAGLLDVHVSDITGVSDGGVMLARPLAELKDALGWPDHREHRAGG